jgi:hypothetical protein
MPGAWWMRLRAGLLLAGALALVSGLYGGFVRIGWPLPSGSSLSTLHGPILISGLFGTLVALERAVALDRGWAYLGPILSSVGSIAILMGAPVAAGAGAYAAAGVILVASTSVVMIHQPQVFMASLVLGAVAWLVGSLVWLQTDSVSAAAGWWLAFLILTIAGERLELSRLMPRRRGSTAIFLLSIGLLLAGSYGGLLSSRGSTLFGFALILLGLWLFRHDLARRTIRQKGQTRFFAACMISGYAWLLIAGLGLILFPPGETALGYDLALHAVLIGFVLSMVFGHALIILPAVARVRLAYHPALYGPLALLHLSLVLRMIGDTLAWHEGRQWSGMITVLALLSFALCVATSAAARSRNASLARSRS